MKMMSVSDLFYGGREPVWIVNTPPSAQKSVASNPQPLTPQAVTPVTHVISDGFVYKPVVELKVPVCCEACEDRVKHALLNLNGVESVRCSSFDQRVVVTGNAAPADVLKVCRKLHKRSELIQKKTTPIITAIPMASPIVMPSPRWGLST